MLTNNKLSSYGNSNFLTSIIEYQNIHKIQKDFNARWTMKRKKKDTQKVVPVHLTQAEKVRELNIAHFKRIATVILSSF